MQWGIIGHNKIISFLEIGIKNSRLTHAYLFYGPKSVGKKTLVKQFILNLLCFNENPEKEKIPCMKCDACCQTKKNINPDVVWIKKEADKKNITVEQIRNLENDLSVHSFFKSYKVAVIENAEDMSLASANALLKTLEEPTKKTILILIAQKTSNLPKTILSRVQKIKFLPVAGREIEKYLISSGQTRERSRELAKLSNGRPGRALIFLKNIDFWDIYTQQLNNFFALLKTNRVNKIKFVENFLSSKESLVEKNKKIVPMLNLWQMLLRDLILHELDQDDKIINTIGISQIQSLRGEYSLKKMIGAQNEIEKIKKLLNLNVNPKLVLENLLLSF